jgi:hypothetical protein
MSCAAGATCSARLPQPETGWRRSLPFWNILSASARSCLRESYAQGRAEGEAKGKAELLIRQLGLRFGALSDVTRVKILSAGPDRLDVWAERVITGRSLEEILG